MNLFVQFPAALNRWKYSISDGVVSACVICTALCFAFQVRQADAQIAVAGSLAADLKPSGLAGANNTWTNVAPVASSVGDFQRADMGALSVQSINGTFKGNPITTNALAITSTAANSLVSALNVPTALTGNGTRSVEAWILAPDAAGTQGVVSWGVRGSNNMMSRMSYNSGQFGMISGWFNDSTWTGPLITGDIAHVVWTFDSATNTARGYLNGVLNTTFAHPAALQTPASLMYIGTAPGGNNDPFHGYIAELRVHTGLLNDAQVLNNYNAGIEAPPGLACDFNNDTACNSTDFTTLTNNLFTSGNKSAGDYNLDGVIDLKDLRAFKNDPMRVVGGAGAGAISAVPEPTSFVFVAFACVAVIFSTRRRVA